MIAGPGGIRIYRQETPQRFTDVTSRSEIPADILKGSYLGAWPFDVDLDGDLDIVLAVKDREPIVLRNNGDGTFGVIRPFTGITGGSSFVAADLDGDGIPDVAMVGSDGKLSVFMNQRFGRFKRHAVPKSVSDGVGAVTAGNVAGNGSLDLVELKLDGTINRLSSREGNYDWETSEIGRASAPLAGTASISLADFDNNGRLDLLTGSGDIFLAGEHGFSKLTSSAGVSSATAVDLNGDGRLDIAAVSGGKPVALINHGAKNYHWQVIRVRWSAASVNGLIHLGLAEKLRSAQACSLRSRQSLRPCFILDSAKRQAQTLPGSRGPTGAVRSVRTRFKSIYPGDPTIEEVPALLYSPGTASRCYFVKDGAPWSPRSAHINAQRVAGIRQTEEWFKIPGDEVAPRDGYYDLRVTAELWETFYIDHYSLLAVDHAQGTDVYTDERFAVPPPRLQVYATSTARPFARAVDDQANDVSGIVRDTDQNYLDTFNYKAPIGKSRVIIKLNSNSRKMHRRRALCT